MAIKQMIMNPGVQPTKEQLEEIRVAAKRPITYTEDAPELTDEQLSEFKPANPNYYRANKSQITLRLDAILLDAFKSTGKGYQSKINEALWKGASEMGIIERK